MILRSAQRGLGGFLGRLERHGVDFKKHVALFDWPIWFNRNLGHLPSHARNDRNDVILRPHIGRRRRYDVHEQNQNRQRNDRDGDDNYLAGDVPGQQLELEENQPNDDRVDDKENQFHCASTLS